MNSSSSPRKTSPAAWPSRAADERHLLRALCAISNPSEMRCVLDEILTSSEYAALLKRWTILRLLRTPLVQREIARRVGGSLCNVTRGARIVRSGRCASTRLMQRLESKP